VTTVSRLLVRAARDDETGRRGGGSVDARASNETCAINAWVTRGGANDRRRRGGDVCVMRPARTSRCGFRASWKANGRGVFDRLGDAFGRRRARRARRGGDDRLLKISTRISIVGGGVFDRDRRRDCVVVRRGDETATSIATFDEATRATVARVRRSRANHRCVWCRRDAR